VTARTKARKRALDLLFEADLRGTDAAQLAASRELADAYALRLIQGVVGNRSRIDDLIATYSSGWSIDRMPAIDRNLLRIAIYEILFESATPVAVAIDEAVELAKSLSTDESAAFLNGLLGQVAPLRTD
jgi:N utilization substance protein B